MSYTVLAADLDDDAVHGNEAQVMVKDTNLRISKNEGMIRSTS